MTVTLNVKTAVAFIRALEQAVRLLKVNFGIFLTVGKITHANIPIAMSVTVNIAHVLNDR
jgi:hypothetical protein